VVFSRVLRIGSRGSALARWQAEEVRRRLEAEGCEAAIEFITTTGDRRTDVPLAAIGGKGLFTAEIEAALGAETIDLAVHSLKDVPSALPAGFVLAAVLEREDARDALVGPPGATLLGLARGARVGTSSLRRQAQLLALRPDLVIQPLRGNVDTRLRRWREGEHDALVLAAAGLHRLGLAGSIAEYIDVRLLCPAGGQGALALQCRAEDAEVRALLARLNHAPTETAVACERALLRRLECGCQAPVGAFARWDGDQLVLSAVVANAEGTALIRREAKARLDPGDAATAEVVGVTLAEELLAAGAEPLLDRGLR